MSPKQKFRKQIYYMTSEEFAAALVKEFGDGAQSQFSRLSGLSRSIISRYCGAKVRRRVKGQWIPKDVIIMFQLIKTARRNGWKIPDPEPREFKDAA
jgi:hypothetical protein